ncbi:MAG: phosphoribosylamine--glycine ligase [Nitrospiraceae bacterium]|nr:phosphoribosylamine--glycine ligase [Nitrospiraceae bacterium]
MKVLVIGGGGREHAIVWRLAQSRRVDKIYCCPGNAGIAELAECVDIRPTDFDGLMNLVRYEWIDLTIVGPEDPLAAGLADVFRKDGRKIFGPGASAARLESSKVFSKDFMRRYGIPTAEYKVFNSYIHAEDYVRLKGAPIVIKADGLAAGKGVFVAGTVDEACEAIRLIMKERAFGEAGDRVVVEKCIGGEEASFMAFTDGRTFVPMVSSQDHKRIFDKDLGPNTGGMGAYSPAPVLTEEVERAVMEKVMKPFLHGVQAERMDFRGVIYAGLMIRADGSPMVLEFNCRFGDPETQAVLARLDSDFFEVALAVSEGKLGSLAERAPVAWRPDASVCVVLASGGYPGGYEKGKIIKGLEAAKKMKDVVVFHAGTGFDGENVVTAGGRVLGVTATGSDVRTAKARAYDAVAKISFEGMHYRNDIADRAVGRIVC